MKQAQKGLFISFEGIDGAGKSTHIQALADAFKASGRAVTLTREPGGTALAEKLYQIVGQFNKSKLYALQKNACKFLFFVFN